MPKTPRFSPKPPRSSSSWPTRVQLLDIAGPLQVFASANELAARPARRRSMHRAWSRRRSGRDRLRRAGLVAARCHRRGGARHASGRRRSGCPCGCRRSRRCCAGWGHGAACASNRFGLHRRLPAGCGRLAGRPARRDALDALCRTRPALSGRPVEATRSSCATVRSGLQPA